MKRWLCRKPIFGLLGLGTSILFGLLHLDTVAIVTPFVLPIMFMLSETLLDRESIRVKKGDIEVEIGKADK
jgi:hypothetical protein